MGRTFSFIGVIRFNPGARQNALFVALSICILALLSPFAAIAAIPEDRLPAKLQNGTLTATPVTDAKGQLIYRDSQTLKTIMTDGSAQNVISLGTGFNALCPSLSHDGRQMAFIGGAAEFGLYIVTSTGGTPRALLKATPPKDAKTPPVDAPIGVPSWSPDSKTIAYTGQSGALYLINVSDGKQKATLTALKFFSVDWSPDGKQFVAFAEDSAGKPGVFTLATDGSSMQASVSLSDADLTLALSRDHFFARDTVLPRWSPDGKEISYSAIASGSNVPSVYMITTGTGSTPTQITDPKTTAYGASWSSDSKYLAYTTENGDQRAITLSDLSQPRFGPIVAFNIGGCPVWKPGK